MTRYMVVVLLVVTVNSVLDAQTTQGAAAKSQVQNIRPMMDEARQAKLRGDDYTTHKIFDKLIEMAKAGFATKDFDVSVSVLLNILDLEPRYPGALFTLAEIYSQVGNPVRAAEYYNDYLKINPNDPAALVGRGLCYFARSAYNLAIADFRRLVNELDPTNVTALANLAMAITAEAAERGGHDVRKYDEAMGYMNRAVQLSQQSTDEKMRANLPELRYRLASLSFRRQQVLEYGPEGADYQISLNYYNRAVNNNLELLKSDPTNTKALDILTKCYDGMAMIHHVLTQQDPNNAEPYLALADIAERRARIGHLRARILILEFLKKAVLADPNRASLRIVLASEGYGRLGMIEEANAEIDNAIRLAPENKKECENLRKRLQATTQPAISSKPTGET